MTLSKFTITLFTILTFILIPLTGDACGKKTLHRGEHHLVKEHTVHEGETLHVTIKRYRGNTPIECMVLRRGASEDSIEKQIQTELYEDVSFTISSPGSYSIELLCPASNCEAELITNKEHF